MKHPPFSTPISLGFRMDFAPRRAAAHWLQGAHEERAEERCA